MVILENYLLDAYQEKKEEEFDFKIAENYSGVHLADFYLTKIFEWNCPYIP